MYLLQNLNKLELYLTSLILITAIFGDYVVIYNKLHVFQALFDNATHFLIGGISWLIVCLNSRGLSSTEKFTEVVCCCVLSSLIDLDHFIEARSLSLKDATNLKRRPFLHCSTPPFLGYLLLIIIGHIIDSYALKRSSLISLTAFISHHTRDATRRGFWLFPFGSTPPIPYIVYLGLSCILPHFISFIDRYFKLSNIRDVELTVIKNIDV